jgi:hypothetical protein
MLLDRRSRFLIKHDLVVRPRRGVGAALAVEADGAELDVLTVLNDSVEAGTASQDLRAGDVLRITSAQRLDETLGVILFRRRDANASTQFFEHAATRALRRSDRSAHEDPAVSAHLFIDLRPQAEGSYRAIIEEAPGLGPSYILPLLNSILRDRPYPSLDRRGVEVESRTHLELNGLPSQTVGAALQGGGIDFIELVRPPRLDGLDTAGLNPSPERLRFGLRRGDGAGPLAMINRVRGFANAQGWPEMRVQVVSATNRRKTVQVARDADAATILFVQSELVETRNDLPSCSDAVNDELVAHARRLFAAVRAGHKVAECGASYTLCATSRS